MAAKLTLTINEDVINAAKEYARRNGKSLSGIVEHYLQAISAPERKAHPSPSPIRKLKGSIQLPADFDYKKSTSGFANKPAFYDDAHPPVDPAS